MDNRTISVVSMGEEGIAHAVALIWPNAKGGRATHYLKTTLNNEPTLIFFWAKEGENIELPFGLDEKGVVNAISGWLLYLEYGPEPDHDGHNERGWRIFTDNWGFVGKFRNAIVAVQPSWAMFGK